MRETNSKKEKNEKNRPKNQFFGAGEGEGAMKLKSGDCQKAHLRLLLNVNTKFQLPNSICRRDRGGTALF